MSTTTKVTTPKARLSYPHIAKPQAAQEGGKAKYSCALVFEPGTDLRPLQAAALEAAKDKFGATFKVAGKDVPIAEAFAKGFLKSPFRRDAEAKGYAEGSVFLNVRTEQQPQAVYAHAAAGSNKPAPIPQEKIIDDLYAGCYVRATLRAFGYDNSGNKGVSFALNNIQKLGEGERLDNRTAAEDDFEAQELDASNTADLDSIM